MTTRDVGAERDAAIAGLVALARQTQDLAEILRAHPDLTVQASTEEVRAFQAFFRQLNITSRALIAWERGLRRRT
jgi:hypothetical protein